MIGVLHECYAAIGAEAFLGVRTGIGEWARDRVYGAGADGDLHAAAFARNLTLDILEVR